MTHIDSRFYHVNSFLIYKLVFTEAKVIEILQQNRKASQVREDVHYCNVNFFEFQQFRMLFLISFVDRKFVDATTFWKQYGNDLPLLSRMAQCYLSTPATSVSSESAFSVSAHYGRKERSRILPENLAMSVFLKDKL